MKRSFILTAILFALAAAAFGQATPTPSPKPAPTPAPYDKLKVGDMAPDFTLPDTAGNKVKLSDFRSKNNVVLAFFVLAFTGG
jgi:cytochrome oxidase Cu insertion factor (SCO1/SenC/PrrC family)